MVGDEIELRRVSENQVEYPLGCADGVLFADLTFLINVVTTYGKTQYGHHSWILTETDDSFSVITESLEKLSQMTGVAYARRTEVEEEILLLLTVLNNCYTTLSNFAWARSVGNLMDKLLSSAKRLKKLTKPLRRSELKAYNNYIHDYTVEPAYLSIKFTDQTRIMKEKLWEKLNKEMRDKADEEKKKAQARASKIEQTARAFEAVFPELAQAFRNALDLLEEVEGLGTLTIEDEHFVEQVLADYIPHILAAVGKLSNQSHAVTKETVVSEAIKQFHIIQAGLQRIIDKAVKKHLDDMHSQTDFLTQKVLGDESLTLSFGEAQAQLEEVAEEAQRVREALYQKHVAPVLEANKTEYERKLEAQRTKMQEEFGRDWKAREEMMVTEIYDLHDQKTKLTRTLDRCRWELEDKDKSIAVLEHSLNATRKVTGDRTKQNFALTRENEALRAEIAKFKKEAKRNLVIEDEEAERAQVMSETFSPQQASWFDSDDADTKYPASI